MSLDVFRKLRLKLAVIIMFVLAVVLALIIGTFNLYLRSSNRRQSELFMTELVANEGRRPRPSGGPMGDMFDEDEKPNWKPDATIPPRQDNKADEMNGRIPPEKPSGQRMPEAMPQNEMQPPEMQNQNNSLLSWFLIKTNTNGFRNYYTAKLDENGNVTQVVNNFSEQYDSESVAKLVNDIFKLKKTTGVFELFRYTVAKKDYGYLIVLLDSANEINQERRFGLVSLILFGVSLLIAFGISWTFSMWSIKPVQDAFIKQKQFIADASHELKTPIAVIGANIDVLQQEIPNNKWLEYIKTENIRMGVLVKDLLYLAKNDAGRDKLTMLPFDLGDAAACAILPFESVAFEQGKTLEIAIPKDPIPITADEAKIKQVVIILTDNALKNSEKGAVIRVTAGYEGSKRFVKVYNTGHGIAPEDLQKIFNRFYRVDTSRDRNTGGYGLGLAIAQTIAKAHDGKINVTSELGKYAEFTLLLPSGEKEPKYSWFFKEKE
jgi:signal transduction histidine kinase